MTTWPAAAAAGAMLVLLALVVGCSSGRQVKRQQIVLRVMSDGDPMVVAAKLNGKGPFALAVLPEAELSFLDPVVVRRIGLPVHGDARLWYAANGRTVWLHSYLVSGLKAGELDLRDVHMWSAAELRGHFVAGAQGVLGRDILDAVEIVGLERSPGQ